MRITTDMYDAMVDEAEKLCWIYRVSCAFSLDDNTIEVKMVSTTHDLNASMLVNRRGHISVGQCSQLNLVDYRDLEKVTAFTHLQLTVAYLYQKLYKIIQNSKPL